MNHEKNLYPYSFKKGQSGNPKGRPKGAKGTKTVTGYMQELLDCKIDTGKNHFTLDGEKVPVSKVLAIKIIMGAIEGDNSKIKELLDRLEGKPKDTLLIEDPIVDADELYSSIKGRLSDARKTAISSPKKSRKAS